MPRFFMDAAALSGKNVYISGADAEHVKVLRLRVGDTVIICDGRSLDHRCLIKNIAPGMVEAEILERIPCPAEASVRVSILAGLPKQGERADYIVQKCTESGAAEIVFFMCHRCVARPDAKGMEKKLQRWQRIAEEAAKQSGRGIIPEVSFLDSCDAALKKAAETQLPLFMYETGERVSLRQAIEKAGMISSAAIITGPEGGFEDYEAAAAAGMGMAICAMGPRILRCETAPLTALTALMYATDNL